MKKKNILKLRRNLSSVGNLLRGSNLPALEAEILLAEVLHKTRTDLFTHPETKVRFEEAQTFEKFVRRRSQGEPLAYVLGHKEFYGLSLKIDPRALIPRPETEELVLEVLKLNPKSVADIGTGSGAIALALAVHLPKAKIYAIDVSEEALDLARENADLLKLTGRITFLRGNLAEPLPEPVAVMAANLPYIMTSWIKTLPPEIKDHEPTVALDGGTDGLLLYRELFNQAGPKLLAGGRILYELDGRVLVWSRKD
jgi:release factor glutamine methyltransferase